MTTIDWLKNRKAEAVLADIATAQPIELPDTTADLPVKNPRIPEHPIFDDLQTNIFSEAEKISDHSTSRIGALGSDRVNIGVSRVEADSARVNIDDSAPHLLADGTLVIPFKSDPKYHWWKGGQSISQTRAEMLAKQSATQLTNRKGK